MKVEEVRAATPTLVLDAGNALFRDVLGDTEVDRQRAELILGTMGQLKTAAMAVGLRDLNLGPEWLKERAQKAKLPLLSANLKVDGKPFFEVSRVVTVGAVKVGLVGVTGPAKFGKFPRMVSEQPVAAALAEAKKLRGKVELVVVLAAIPYADGLELMRTSKDIDLVLESGESRSDLLQSFETTYLSCGGERGRSITRLDLDLAGKGPLADMAAVNREKMRLEFLTNQIAEAKRRLTSALSPESKKQLEETVAGFERQKEQVARSLVPFEKAGGRTLTPSRIELGPEVAGDPVIQAAVDKLEPPAR